MANPRPPSPRSERSAMTAIRISLRHIRGVRFRNWILMSAQRGILTSCAKEEIAESDQITCPVQLSA